MEVHFPPDVQEKLDRMAREAGRSSEELLQDAVIGHFDELTHTREMLDRRYDDLKSGRVQPIDGEAFFESLRRREDELIEKRSLK